MSNRISTVLTASIATVALSGCATSVKDELDAVAKDWSMVMRASQVIPVYPLTEDLRPGDVFLVDTPIAQQANLYEERGFLPLDQLVCRLPDLDYKTFYKDGYFKGRYSAVPHPHPHPHPINDAQPAPGDPQAPPFGVVAPRAAFPSYAFTVDSGRGLRLALPIKGVPLGLALMQAQAAKGSVTISDSYTYGVDTVQLLKKLHDWAQDGQVRYELARLHATFDSDRLFLRVVSRVFLTRGIVVSMVRTQTVAGALDVGAPKNVVLANVHDEQSRQNYSAALAALSGALNDAIPGGSVRVAQASARAVTLAEEFDRPLAIGYLGFDVAIERTGELGAPTATFNVLEGTVGMAGAPSQTPPPSLAQATARVRNLLARDPEAALRALQSVAARMPAEFFAPLTASAMAAKAVAGEEVTAQSYADQFFAQLDLFVNACETGPRERVAAAFLSAAIGYP